MVLINKANVSSNVKEMIMELKYKVGDLVKFNFAKGLPPHI